MLKGDSLNPPPNGPREGNIYFFSLRNVSLANTGNEISIYHYFSSNTAMQLNKYRLDDGPTNQALILTRKQDSQVSPPTVAQTRLVS